MGTEWTNGVRLERVAPRLGRGRAERLTSPPRQRQYEENELPE
jgi:hypothetical protein